MKNCFSYYLSLSQIKNIYLSKGESIQRELADAQQGFDFLEIIVLSEYIFFQMKAMTQMRNGDDGRS